MTASVAHRALNFLAFQLGWFSCVLGAAQSLPWLGVVVVGLVLILHLALLPAPARELPLIAIGLLLGLVFDSALVASGWLAYPNGILIAGTAPVWILAMWVAFTTTLNVSMRWMKGRLLLAALMGAAFGPLSYLAGARLGGVAFVEPALALAALGLGWSVALPLLVHLSERYNGMLSNTRAASIGSTS